jgi:hypothetical protein
MVRILVALLALVIVGCPQWVRAQADADTSATTYFLEEPPAAIDRSKLPATARDVLVAKVRIVGRVVYLGGRHPWDPPQPRPKTVLGAEVEILDVLSGSAVKSTRHIVVFLERGSGQRHKYPHVPKAYERDYFIVSYLNEETRVSWRASRRMPRGTSNGIANVGNSNVKDRARVQSTGDKEGRAAV